MSVVMAFGLGDEFTDGLVTGDVVARTPASRARRQTRTGDDNCPGTAVAGRAGERAQDRSQARRASGHGGYADGGGNSGRARRGGGGLEEAAERSGDKLPAREFAGGENLLNDERRGDRTKYNPKRDHDDTE